MGMGQNLVPLVNPKIAGKWMFIPLNLVCIGIDPYPHLEPNMLNTPKHQDPLVVFAGSELFLFHCLTFPTFYFCAVCTFTFLRWRCKKLLEQSIGL